MILMVVFVVLSTATASCSILLAPMVSNLPHIHLQLGSNLDYPNCPVMQCIVDMAAALSTGNFHFVAAVAKRYPHYVAKIYVPKDYNPIVLSGIVQRGGDSVTIELTIGFQFHLSYLTKEGNPTSILIATRPHVTINMIVGLPFIQAMCAVINLAKNVAELHALDAPPFPLEYRCATVHVPAIIGEGKEQPVHMASAYCDLIAEINALERHFTSANVIQASEMEGELGLCQVRFGTSPIKSNNTMPHPLSAAANHPTEAGHHGFVEHPMDCYSDPDMGMIDINMK